MAPLELILNNLDSFESYTFRGNLFTGHSPPRIYTGEELSRPYEERIRELSNSRLDLKIIMQDLKISYFPDESKNLFIIQNAANEDLFAAMFRIDGDWEEIQLGDLEAPESATAKIASSKNSIYLLRYR